mgnify:CR=1 FL=1
MGGKARLAEPAGEDGRAARVGDRGTAIDTHSGEVAHEEGVAVGGHPGGAVDAGAARVEGQYHMVTGLHLGDPVSYTHLRAHETVLDLVCRLLLEKKKNYKKHVTST